MTVTLLDGIVITVVAISALLAMVRGFVREVLSVASWVGAAGAAYLLYKPILPYLTPYIPSLTLATIAAVAGIFFIALIVTTFFAMKVADFVLDSKVGFLDRALGLAFGAARGILIMSVAFLFFSWLTQKPPEWVAKAETRPLLENVGARLREALPKDLETQLLNRMRGPPPVDETGADKSGEQEGSAGSAEERKALENLIQNSGGARR